MARLFPSPEETETLDCPMEKVLPGHECNSGEKFASYAGIATYGKEQYIAWRLAKSKQGQNPPPPHFRWES